jgi:predicted MFS family arabinose efflux permease
MDRRPGSRGRAPASGLRRNVSVLAVTSAAISASLLTWSPVVALLLRQRGASAADVAITYAMLNLGNSLAQYVGGVAADRYGAKAVVTLATLGIGASFAGVALGVTAWPVFAAFYVLANTAMGFQATSFVTLVSDSVPAGERSAAFAHFQSWSALALVLGPTLGAFAVLPHLPPRWFVLLTAATYGVGGGLRAWLLREPRALLPTKTVRPSWRHVWEAAAGSRERRRLLALSVGATLSFALTVNGPFLSLVAHVQDGLAPHLVELLFAVGPLGGLAAAALLSRRAVREGPLLVGGLAAHALAALALSLRLGWWAAAAAYVVLYTGYQAATIGYSTVRPRLASPQETGAVLGATGGLATLSAALGTFLGGALGPSGALLLAAAVSLATVAFWLVAHPERAPSRPVVAHA